MPSQALSTFNDSAEDVVALLDAHEGVTEAFAHYKLGPPARLDVLFPSATVLMVSHWEAFVEDIASEALEYLVAHVPDATHIPIQIKKRLAKEIKQDPNEIALWRLADAGWRHFIKERLTKLKEGRDRFFNTPKAQQTADFIEEVLGIEDVRDAWTFGDFNPTSAAESLNALIEVRGKIAHRGKMPQQINGVWVREKMCFLRKLVGATEGRINRHVSSVTGAPVWT